MSIFNKEPAVVLGLIASIIVLIAQQILTSGIVTNASGVNVLNLVISVVPLIASIITRQFVSPA